MRRRFAHHIDGPGRTLEEINGDDGDNNLIGTSNEFNIIRAMGGNDFVFGANLGDDIFGGAGDDRLFGNSGEDLLVGDVGNDTLDGGSGDDSIVAGIRFGADVDNDTVDGGSGDDRIDSQGGNDTLSGGTGDDEIYFFEGATVDGGSGDDVLYEQSTASGAITTIHGGTGDDILYEYQNTGAEFFFYGDAGEDLIDYSQYTETGVVIDLTLGFAYGNPQLDLVAVFRVEDATGTGMADILTGDGTSNVLIGGEGDDTIAGRFGGDWLDGGFGTDTLDYSASGQAVSLSLATGTLHGGDAEGDRIMGFERYVGSDFADIMVGTLGNDTFVGGKGDDVLSGSKGSDAISGGDGNDTITGGLGTDLATGGAGKDRFVYLAATDASTYDEIIDFHRKERDLIDFKTLDADPALAGDQRLTFIGTAAFDGGHGEMRVDYSSGIYALLKIDLNGDLTADMTIYVDGVTTAQPLRQTDFVL